MNGAESNHQPALEPRTARDKFEQFRSWFGDHDLGSRGWEGIMNRLVPFGYEDESGFHFETRPSVGAVES